MERPSPLAFLLAPQAPGTGNAATAARLGHLLESRGMRVLSVDPAALVPGEGADGEAAAAVDQSGAEVVIALHGIKSARLVIGCKAPMILVTGGTDVNVDIVTDSQKAATMARVLRWVGTAAVVSFTGAMIEAMHALLEDTVDIVPTCTGERWREGAPSVHLIPQGVELPPRPPSCSDVATLVQRIVGTVLRDGEPLSAARERVLLLVAGLRPVKDVLYLADAVDAAWGRGAGLRLVVVGSRLDDAYSTLVQERAEKSPGAFILLPENLSRDACIELMRHCAAVVNSSTSEGMSGALLEALATGTPVLARRIPGNVALADMARKAGGGAAGSTSASVGGVVIYDTPEHFIRQSEALFLAGSLQVDPGATGADGLVEQTAGVPTPPICLSAADLGADGLKAAQTMAVDERIAWNAVLDAVVSSTQTFDSASTTGRPVG